jgi:hypothetical protein
MKRKFELIAIFLIICQVSFSQVKLLKDSLKKERRNVAMAPEKFVVEYTDMAEPFNLEPRAKGSDGNNLEVVASSINSIEKLNEIKRQIFSVDEMKFLAENNCQFKTIVHSSGKIESVTIIFFNHDPQIDVNKLTEFSKQIKQKLTFDFTFAKKLEQHGYYLFTTKAFPEYMNSGYMK